MVVPPKHPKMIIFSRKTHGCWVPPFWETNISFGESTQQVGNLPQEKDETQVSTVL